MKKTTLIAIFMGIILVELVLTGCTSSARDNARFANGVPPAKLIGYEIGERFVHIKVLSKGCTVSSSYQLQLVSKAQNSIQVIQNKPDNCNMKPIPISLSYAFRHLGTDRSRPVKIVNPLDSYDIAKAN
jgi:hypothetical protein